MQLDKVSLAESHAFSPFFVDYIQQKDTLKPFYGRFPDLNNFDAQIAEKLASFPRENRNTLVKAIQSQYAGLTVTPAVERNLAALGDTNTFTITTGHQLNIFTGPLYFIFKIVTVINTCKQLKAQYPKYNFVPVYWMASEDHDYDEIKYFNLYGKKYVWNTDQQGAVGRFSTDGLETLLNSVPGETRIFREAYTQNKKLGDAVRYYVNALLGAEGLVVVDADDRAMKSQFADVVRADVFTHVNKEVVDRTNTSLETLGYKTQVYCREINFFYLDDGIRNRIERKDDQYVVVDRGISFSRDQIEKLIQEEPEKFSPNVILRPLYQECVLPNLAYVGGPAEIIYWLQLKSVFTQAKTPFPILMPRNFGMIMDHEVARKFAKTGLALETLFEEKNFIFNHWILRHSPRNLTVGAENKQLEQIFELLREKAGSIDKTLVPLVTAEGTRAAKNMEKIERKFLRAEKRLHSDKLRQIECVKDALFPNGKLQERIDNFLNFYQRDPEFIQRLLDTFDPFDFRFNILSYTA